MPASGMLERQHLGPRLGLPSQLNTGVRAQPSQGVGEGTLPGRQLLRRFQPMTIRLELSAAEEQQLAAVAARLNLPAEVLATAALRELIERRSADFEHAADRVLEKNAELYRRLA